MRHPLLQALLATALVGLAPAVATAQQASPVQPGTRVRLTLDPGATHLVGDYVGRRGDSLEIWTRKATSQMIARDRVSKVEVSGGTRRARLKSALYGGVIGAGLGFILGAVVKGGDNSSSLFISTRAATEIIWTSIGFGTGFGVGSTFTLTKGERWLPGEMQ